MGRFCWWTHIELAWRKPRRVFTNMFQNRIEHERQLRKNIEWRFIPGMRFRIWQQRNR